MLIHPVGENGFRADLATLQLVSPQILWSKEQTFQRVLYLRSAHGATGGHSSFSKLTVSGSWALQFECVENNETKLVPEMRNSRQKVYLYMHRHAKTPCPGWEVATFREAAKRERRGDNLTGKQNSSTTIGTWRLGTAAFSETSDLDPFSRY